MRLINKNVSRKAAAITVATALTVFGGAGAAIAYWTTTGSGTSSASTGTVSALTVHQTADLSGLTPGGSAKNLSGDFTNPNSGAVTVASVSAVVDPAWAEQADPSKPACSKADFTIAGTGTAAGEIAPGPHTGSWSGLTIALKDRTGVNQDNCKSVTVPLVLSAS